MITKKTFSALVITSIVVALVSLTGVVSSIGLAQTQSLDFAPIDAAVATWPVGINDSDVITGQYVDPNGNGHGFLLKDGKYTLVDVPNAQFTEVAQINNAGVSTGDYVAADGVDRPFVRQADGTLALKPGFAGASVTFGFGINSRGDIDGSYTLDPMGATGFKGFVMRGNDFIQTFSYPGMNVTNTLAFGMNEGGAIVGSFGTTTMDEEHGFLRSADGRFSQIDFPGSRQSEAFGINAAGDIVGRYLDANGKNHGYLLRAGKFTSIDYAGPQTCAWGINSKGTIVGISLADLSTGPIIGFKLPNLR